MTTVFAPEDSNSTDVLSTLNTVPTQAMLPTNATWFYSENQTLNLSCLLSASCQHFHFYMSSVIFTGGLFALFENLLLVIALNTLEVMKTCKMFWFLWHLALADGIVAISFAYYHMRILISCPLPYSCNSSYSIESFALLVCFFGTILASHLFILAATVDRSIAVQWSLRYTLIVTTKGARVTAILIWTLSFSIPILAVIGMTLWHSQRVYSIITNLTAAICLACAFIVILLNLWMVLAAWTKLRKHPHVSERYRNTRNSFANEMKLFQDRFKVAITLSLFVCSFVLSCAPWSIALITCGENRHCVLKRDQDYTLVLVLSHAIAIPILYGFRVEEIKRHVINFWKKFLLKLVCNFNRNLNSTS